MITILPPRRISDKWGEGHFGASRGHRKHNGEDVNCYPGSRLMCPLKGIISKFGYPYADDLSFRYIQITDEEELDYRFFYVEPNPALSIGDNTHYNMELGVVQDLGKRYPGIDNHIHVEIKDSSGNYIDPNPFLKG